MPIRRKEKQRCTCGACHACRRRADEARWERIYRAKFEDPDYYSRGIHLSPQSSLAHAEGLDLRGLYSIQGSGTEFDMRETIERAMHSARVRKTASRREEQETR